jgi:uncharacterized membrane protein YhiD involved in acid resistance
VEAVLELGLEKVTVQNASPACLVRDSVTASVQSSAAIWVLERVGLVEHAEAAEVVGQVILMAFGQIDFAVDQVSLAYGDPLDCSNAALAQTVAEVAKVLQHHHLAFLDSQQADLETEVLVVRPASQLDSGHRIHATLAPVPSCISGKS